MYYRSPIARKSENGQSIVEAAILVPFLIVVLFNAVNIGYFFTVALHLSTAPRQGAEYSIQGPISQVNAAVPTAANVYSLVNADVTGAVSTISNPKVQVCSSDLGLSGTGSSQVANCQQYNSFPATTPHADPEAPSMVLHRVDIQYQVAPLIPGTLFNIVPAPTIHRYVEMRSLQ
jgi:Flp pilus assembly protein TadG